MSSSVYIPPIPPYQNKNPGPIPPIYRDKNTGVVPVDAGGSVVSYTKKDSLHFTTNGVSCLFNVSPACVSNVSQGKTFTWIKRK